MSTKLYTFHDAFERPIKNAYAFCPWHLSKTEFKPGFSRDEGAETTRRCCKCIEEPAPGGRIAYNDLPPFTAHRPTSELAAFLIESKALNLRQKVYSYILRCGELGAIDHDVAAALNLQADTARPRRRELELRGHVIDSGKTRKSPKNRDAIVWVAVPW